MFPEFVGVRAYVTTFVVLTVFCSSHASKFFQDVIIHAEHLEADHCPVPKQTDLQWACDSQTANLTVPHGTQCVYSSKQGVQNIICDNGLYYPRERYTKAKDKSGPRLKKRWWGSVGRFFSKVGHAIGHVVVKTAQVVNRVVTSVQNAVACVVTLFFVCDTGGHSGSGTTTVIYVSNKPPTISCPSVTDKTAGRLETYTLVTWKLPTAQDPENKGVNITLVSGKQPGSLFGEGTHSVLYQATDDVGNAAYCAVRFTVNVTHCYENVYVEKGKADCKPTNRILGTRCTIRCREGYKLSNDSVTHKTCGLSGFNSGKTTCIRKQCDPPPKICNGILFCTNGNFFGSVCYPRCSRGYEMSGKQQINCTENGWKGIVTGCEDSKPPSIKCPPTKQVFADRRKTKMALTWNLPTVTDNSQKAAFLSNCGSSPSKPTITQIEGPSLGSDFKIGIYDIKYEAEDESGNKASCHFTVIVEELTCDPLFLRDGNVKVRCQGYSINSVCLLSCDTGYSLTGQSSVMCGQHPLDHYRGQWKWQNGTETTCAEIPKQSCTKLKPPVNGALACSSALGSEVCTMSCNKRYQTPHGAHVDYVCNDKLQWQPPKVPANCTSRRNPHYVVKPGELTYFFSAGCSDKTTIQGIKSHFLNVTSTLTLYKQKCPTSCSITNITVTCGPVSTGRHGRSLEYYRTLFKRSTSQISVTFDLNMDWIDAGDYFDNDDKIQVIADYLKTLSNSGQFDVKGLKPAKLEFSLSDMKCDKGTKPDYSENICAGCAPGTYMRVDKCVECEKGYYQEQEYASSCIPCPTNYTTEVTGSMSRSDCKEMCLPGSFSSNGLQPCVKCPMGYYQSKSGSNKCISCKTGTTTQSTGSSGQDQCKDFDVELSSPSSTVQLKPNRNVNVPTDFTIGFWMKCDSDTDSFLVFDIMSHFKIQMGPDIHFNVQQTSDKMKRPSVQTEWAHFAFTWKKSTQDLLAYVNGMKEYSKTFGKHPNDSFNSLNISSSVGTIAGCRISGLFLTTVLLHPNEVSSVASACATKLNNLTYSMDSFKDTGLKHDIMFPSSNCDALNECESDPCKNEGVCINGIGKYECECPTGFSGQNCEHPPDFCADNVCENGATCMNQNTNYSCVCTSGFVGTLCDTEIECQRYLAIYNHKNQFNCSTSDDYTSCTVDCQAGFVFLNEHQPLEKYECGKNTSYEWNAKPPACVSTSSPTRMVVKTEAVYQSVPCEKSKLIQLSILNKVNLVQCMKNKTCSASVQTHGCPDSNRNRRSNSPLEVKIALGSDLKGGDKLKMDNFYKNNIVSSSLEKTMTVFTELIASVTEGSVRFEAVCAECHTGTFWKNETCILCPKGTYQEFNGQSQCSKCPGLFTTPFIGSKNHTDCSILKPNDTNSLSTRNGHLPGSVTVALKHKATTVESLPHNVKTKIDSDKSQTWVIVGAVSSVAALCLICAIFFIWRKHSRKALQSQKKEIGSVASLNMVQPLCSPPRSTEFVPYKKVFK